MTLFYRASKQVQVFAARIVIDSDLEFVQKAVYQNVDAIEALEYSHECFG